MEELSQGASATIYRLPSQRAKRTDRRVRPGRGVNRRQHIATLANHSHFMPQPSKSYYEIDVRQLPAELRNEIDLPIRTRTCYLQVLDGDFQEWRPPFIVMDEQCRFTCTIATTPDELKTEHPFTISAQDAHQLAQILLNPEMPTPTIRIAPSIILPDNLRQAICPGVSYPDEVVVPATRMAKKGIFSLRIPRAVYFLPIERLELSVSLFLRLKRAGISTIGQILEMGEQDFVEKIRYFGDASLQELIKKMRELGVLPKAEQATQAQAPQQVQPMWPIYHECYLAESDQTHFDPHRGLLRMVSVTVIPRRFERSGPVYTCWIRQKDLDGCLIYDRSIHDHLDTLELRERVNAHARAHGMHFPKAGHQPIVRPTKDYWEIAFAEQQDNDDRYNLVPFADELFIRKDAHDQASREATSDNALALQEIEHYLAVPDDQPDHYWISQEKLAGIHDWLILDWERQITTLPYVASPTLIMTPVYATTFAERKPVDELIGYKCMLGVLASTPAPTHVSHHLATSLVIQPRKKPIFEQPERPIRATRVPNYVLYEAKSRQRRRTA